MMTPRRLITALLILGLLAYAAHAQVIPPGGGAGGTQYTQGSAATDTDTMTLAGCVRIHPPAIATGVAAGDRARCIVDGDGRIWVQAGVEQGSQTSGQQGVLMQGAVATSAPAYTSGQTSPLSITTAGELRVSGGGGGTQYTEDDAAAANPVGNTQILIRQDTPGTLVTTDGDNVARRGTNYGAAYTQIVTSTGSFVDSFGGGTQYNQGSAATDTDTMTLAGCVRIHPPAIATGVVAGDRARCIVDGDGRLWVQAGVEQNSTTSGQLGGLIQGAVSTNAPAYTSGRTSPISLSAAGEVRVRNDSGGTTTTDAASIANGTASLFDTVARQFHQSGAAWRRLGHHDGQAFTAQTATGQTTAFDVSLVRPTHHTFVITQTGSPTVCTIQPRYSLDNVTWRELGRALTCTATAESTIIGPSAGYISMDLKQLAGGSSPSITTTYGGSR